MRQRAFATAWQDSKRPRKDDEEAPTGGMQEWVRRIQHLQDADVLADVRRMMGTV